MAQTFADKNFDVLIVGSGLFGATCAYELSKAGHKCLVVEARNHIGGNCYTELKDGINIHQYGAHLFHTNSKPIWDWINQFAAFNDYQHRVKVNYEGTVYSFPLNLNTFKQLWNFKTQDEITDYLEKAKQTDQNLDSLEGWALSQIGRELYDLFIRGYTKKQWGKEPSELPSAIIKRIPIRYNDNDLYFDDTYQGVPIGGYTPIFEKLLAESEVMLGVDFFEIRKQLDLSGKKVIYTGPIDRFFDYQHGHLDYRSLRFELERHQVPDYQGVSVMNYTSEQVPYTRIIEHKHLEFGMQPVTWITKEYPKAYDGTCEPYYPIRDDKNKAIYAKYQKLAQSAEYQQYIFGGRLAEYQYYDMDQVIGSALKKVATLGNSALP